MRKLKDIETTEISLVDDPATKRKFLFFKRNNKVTIGIESDGTAEGTSVKVNGDELKDLDSFSFSFWKPRDTSGEKVKCPISCSYSKIVEAEDGFKRSETFYLMKGDTDMDPGLIELLKSLVGDEPIDFEKKEELSDNAVEAIKSALKTLNKYKDDFPDDLKKAVNTVAKYAGYGYGYPAKKEKEDVEKSGAKFSKDTLEKLKKAIEALEALKSILPELKEQTVEKDGVEKQIEQLTKSIAELENEKKKETETQLTKTLTELTKRLETVEKGTGIKKSVEGQEADNDGDGKEKLWPSLTG